MTPIDGKNTNAKTAGGAGGAGTLVPFPAHSVSLRLRNALLLVVTGFLWGVQPALIKALTERGLPDVATLGLTMVIVTLILGGVLAVRARIPRLTTETAAFLAVAGLVEYAGPLLVAFLVARHLDAGLLTLLMFTTPIFAVALAAGLGAERLDRYGVLGCVCGLVGLALIGLPQNALPSRDMLPWCLAALSVPTMYAFGAVYLSKAWPEDMDAVQTAFGGALLAGLVLTPFWAGPLFRGRFLELSQPEVTIFLSLVASVIIEIVLFFYTLRHAGPVFASFASFFAIMTGFVIGDVFFGENPSHWVWASVVFFSLALGLILVRPAKPD